MDIKEVLSSLCKMPAPVGFERALAEHALTLLAPFVDETHLDRFGNAVALRRCGREGAALLLLEAHLDEIGLIVTGHARGFLRVRPLGGVDPRILPNQSVQILAQPPLFGLISSVPPHLQTANEQEKARPIEELWVDTGLLEDEARARIPVGTPLVFDSPLLPLQEDYLTAKALDNRAGFAALLLCAEELADEPLEVDLCFLGSTREESGGAGAATGCFALAPDCCVVVDVTHGASPNAPQEETFPLGGGPAVGIGPNMQRDLSAALLRLAKAADIPVQREILGGSSGTNAWRIQVAREGIATALLSIPLRYMHTPNEVLKLSDLTKTASLLAAFVRDFSSPKREEVR